METHTLAIDVEEAFGNLHRDRCVLIAATDQNGVVLLGEKPHFYPPSIARLLGGGVEENETLEEAAKREIGEELLGVEADTMTPLLHIVTTARDAKGREFQNETRVFHASIDNQHYQAGGDVARIVRMTPVEMFMLGQQYELLPPTLWHKDEKRMFSWHDYGKLYGPVHKMTALAVVELLGMPKISHPSVHIKGTMIQ